MTVLDRACEKMDRSLAGIILSLHNAELVSSDCTGIPSDIGVGVAAGLLGSGGEVPGKFVGTIFIAIFM